MAPEHLAILSAWREGDVKGAKKALLDAPAQPAAGDARRAVRTPRLTRGVTSEAPGLAAPDELAAARLAEPRVAVDDQLAA